MAGVIEGADGQGLEALARDSVVSQTARDAKARDHAFDLIDGLCGGVLLRSGAAGGIEEAGQACVVRRGCFEVEAHYGGEAQGVGEPVMESEGGGERMREGVGGAEVLLECDGSHGGGDLHVAAGFDIGAIARGPLEIADDQLQTMDRDGVT